VVSSGQFATKPGRQREHVARFAFPHDNRAQSQGARLAEHASVPPPVSSELRNPELPIALRNGRARARRVRMPEASVDEYDPALRHVHDIGRARQSTRTLAESGTEAVKNLADQLLWPGVALANVSQPTRGPLVRLQL
jgi:hypothetical protein